MYTLHPLGRVHPLTPTCNCVCHEGIPPLMILIHTTMMTTSAITRPVKCLDLRNFNDVCKSVSHKELALTCTEEEYEFLCSVMDDCQITPGNLTGVLATGPVCKFPYNANLLIPGELPF